MGYNSFSQRMGNGEGEWVRIGVFGRVDDPGSD